MREKELLLATLEYLKDHKNKTLHDEVYFQLELKLVERIESDKRAARRVAFLEDVKRRANLTQPLAVVPVDEKEDLILLEGMDIEQTGNLALNIFLLYIVVYLDTFPLCFLLC